MSQFLQDAGDIIRCAKASLAGAGGRLTARIMLMLAAGHWYGVAALGVLGETAALVEITAAIGTMGLRRALLGIMAKARDAGKPVEQCIVDAIGLMLILGGCLWLILTAVWPIIYPAGGSAVRQVPVAIAIGVPCIMLTEVALAATRFQRVIRWNVLARSIVEPWSFLFLVVTGYLLEVSNGVLLWAYLGSIVLAMLTALIGLFKVFSLRRLLHCRPTISQAIQIARISFPTGILEVNSMLFRRIDILILGLVAGPAATGVYYMVQQISTVVHKIHDLFEPMVSPVVARQVTSAVSAISSDSNRSEQYRQTGLQLSRTCRWILTIQLGIAVPLAIFGSGVLESFGSGFAMGLLAMMILFLGEITDGSFALSELPLIFTRPKIPPLLTGIALLIEVIAVYWLGSLYGPAGAAAGFALAMLSLSAMRLIILHRSMGLQILDTAFLPALLVAGVVTLLLLLLQQVLIPAPGISLWLAIVSGLFVYWLLIRRFALSQADIELFQNLRHPA